MKEIFELTEQIQTTLDELSNAKQSGNRGQINVLSSNILSFTLSLPKLFHAKKYPDMPLAKEMKLLDIERNVVFLLVKCFGLVVSKRRAIGPILQELLVDIYDSANEGAHYLAKDEVFNVYHEIIEDVAESAFRTFRADHIINVAKFYTDTFMPWIHGIQSPIRKATKRYFRDECRTWGEHTVSNVTFSPKEEGMQIGTKAHVVFADCFPTITFHVKTHQNYGATSSGLPSNQRKEIDLRELFVYKLLEHIGFGPKTYFITHQNTEDTPFNKNALFIATQDVAHTKVAAKSKFFHKVGQLFSYEGLEFRGDENFLEEFTKEIAVPTVTPTKLAATVIDLLSRILHLTDMNEGNFGMVNVASTSKWKILDFVIDPKGRHYIGGTDTATEGFIEGNGAFRYSGETLLSKALTNRPRQEKIVVGFGAVELLTQPPVQKMGFEAATELALNEVMTYMQEKIGESNRAQLLGITKEEEAYANLQNYVDASLGNYHDLSNGLRERHTKEIVNLHGNKADGASSSKRQYTRNS